MNLWPGPCARPAPVNSARLLSYRLETTDTDIFAAAKAQLTEIPGAEVLIGTDPAGAIMTLALRNKQHRKETAA